MAHHTIASVPNIFWEIWVYICVKLSFVCDTFGMSFSP